MSKLLLSFEVPVKFLGTFERYNDYDFLLCSLFFNKEYVDYFKRRTVFKILDNGAFECKQPYSFSHLLDFSQQVRADCIVLPDFIGRGYDTLLEIDRICNSINRDDLIHNGKKVALMGVVQGKDIPECLYCYESLLKNYWIDIVGISYVGIPLNRLDLLKILYLKYHSHGHEYGRKPIHLLGLSHANELQEVVNLNLPIMSCDTTLPVTYGLAGWNIENENKGRTKLNFKIPSFTNFQLNLIRKNILYLRNSIIIKKENG